MMFSATLSKEIRPVCKKCATRLCTLRPPASTLPCALQRPRDPRGVRERELAGASGVLARALTSAEHKRARTSDGRNGRNAAAAGAAGSAE